ncbi:MAG: class I SAM-dependent methyltransferase [Anaerolineae bacterium]|nr:class I SAM-dependent methyltransferase [Anaerolineae bacterium]
MSIYTWLAPYYQKVFPVNEALISLLAQYTSREGNILDIGCGNGQYAALLAARGYAVTAIDSAPEMITIARRNDPVSEYYVLDMQAIDTLPQTYTGIVCLGNVYAYLPPEERSPFLNKVYRQLEPDGIWIVQLVNWDVIIQRTEHHFPDKVIEEEGVMFRRTYTNITPTTVQFKTELLRRQTIIAQDTQQLYPQRVAELKNLHQEIGFQMTGHFSNFNQAPYQPETSGGSVFVFQR